MSCYKDFTRGYSAKFRTDTSTNSAKSTYEETDTKDIEEFITIHVIRDHETVSMIQLQDVYGDKIQKHIYVRRNMKKKLVEIFGNNHKTKHTRRCDQL